MPCSQNQKSVPAAINSFFNRASLFCTEHVVLCLSGLLFLSLILKWTEHFLDPALGRDASYYCLMAQDWYDNGTINEFSWTPPLLTFLMKSGAAVGISVQTTGLALNIIAGVLCTLAGFGIALEITDNKKIALISAALFAVHPGINTISIQIGRDAIYLCLAGFTIWTALAGVKRKSCLLWCISGVCCALSATARFETLEFLPLAGCLLLVAAVSKKLSWKQFFLYGLCFYTFTVISFYGAIYGMTPQMFARYQKYFNGKFAETQKQYFTPQKGGKK
jgi:asparagine N-glycosylation enzyme membrane subunit Stt3